MSAERPLPDPVVWARKLHEAAIDLRLKTRSTAALNLARRLERHAEAILFPQLPRWWADSPYDAATAATGEND